MKNCYESGGLVPGEAKVDGNSPDNDVVHAKLSPGEIVIDRETIAKGPEAILDFVMNQLKNPQHNSKNHFWEGGGPAVNPKQAELAEYFGARPAAGPSAGKNIVKPEDEEFRTLSAAYNNVGPKNMQPAMLNRLRILTAQREYQAQQAAPAQQPVQAQPMPQVQPVQQQPQWDQGYAEGGTVQPKIDFTPIETKIDFTPIESSKETSFGDKAQTALENYGQAMTLGYLPQIQAATEPISAKIFNAVTGENVEADPYLQARDANIARMEKQSAENPKSALAGTAAGIIGSAIVAPELPIIKGAGALKNIGRGAIMGAGYGAAQNPGDVPGEVTPLQVGERLSNAKTGAALGAAVGGAGALIDKGAKALKGSAEAARETANAQAVKASGGMLKDFRKLSENDKVDELGKFALDSGIVKAGDSVKDVAEKSDSFRQKVGNELKSIYKSAQEYFDKKGISEIEGFNPAKSKADILRKIETEMKTDPHKAASVKAASDYLEQLSGEFGEQGLNPKQANDIKTKLDKYINYNRRSAMPDPAKEQAYSYMRDYINDAVKTHIDEIGKKIENPDLAKRLAKANKDYGYAAELQKISEDKVNREMANNVLGLTDVIAGAGGAAAGSVIGEEKGHAGAGAALGLLAGGLSKGAKKFGPAVLASAADKAAPILEKTAVPLGKMLEKAPKEVLQKAAIMEAASLSKAGPKKWSNDGYSVLFKHVDRDEKEYLRSMKDKLLSSPKGQRLLIEASALKPGSKKLDKVLADIKELQK